MKPISEILGQGKGIHLASTRIRQPQARQILPSEQTLRTRAGMHLLGGGLAVAAAIALATVGPRGDSQETTPQRPYAASGLTNDDVLRPVAIAIEPQTIFVGSAPKPQTREVANEGRYTLRFGPDIKGDDPKTIVGLYLNIEQGPNDTFVLTAHQDPSQAKPAAVDFVPLAVQQFGGHYEVGSATIPVRTTPTTLGKNLAGEIPPSNIQATHALRVMGTGYSGSSWGSVSFRGITYGVWFSPIQSPDTADSKSPTFIDVHNQKKSPDPIHHVAANFIIVKKEIQETPSGGSSKAERARNTIVK